MTSLSVDLTVLIIKPDLTERYLDERLYKEIRESGLSVVFTGVVHFDLEMIRRFYQWDEVIHPVHLADYLCSSPLNFLILRGKDAIIRALEIKMRMRSEFFTGDNVKNLMHCSQTPNDFVHEFHELMMVQDEETKATMDEIKTNNQIEAILFRKSRDGNVEYLMLKRAENRGNFWQPITGNVKPHETFEEAAIREMQEETNICSYLRIIDTGYGYNFTDDDRDQYEHVLGVEVLEDAQVIISDEHTEFRWTPKEDAVSLLKYPGNKQGLEILSKLLEK